MQKKTLSKKPNISQTLADSVREMIVLGQLPAGMRINEVHLGANLGISRTPLREALMRLVAEGAVISKARYGFYVSPLTIDEFEQTYAMRALLDPEALRLAGLPTPKQLTRLKELNDRIGSSANTESIIARDNAWHFELVSGCPNRILLGLIEQFIERGRRYELALLRERHNIERTVRDHEDILSALERADLAMACRALRSNMESGKQPIIDWLKSQQTVNSKD